MDGKRKGGSKHGGAAGRKSGGHTAAGQSHGHSHLPRQGPESTLLAQRRWRESRWAVLALLWLASVALGYAGFAYQKRPAGEPPWSVLGTLYAAFQLFTLESGNALGYGRLNPLLETARWMAPLVAAFTAAEAVAALFYDQLQLMRARLFRGHVVICGLGDKGLLLTRAFRSMGHPVFVIEQDEDNDFIQSCRAHGAVVYVGDARQPEALERAQVTEARYLLAVCGDDGTNAEVAGMARTQVREQKRRRGFALTCITHIVNPQLWHLLRRWELGGGTDGFRLQFFNVFDAGARALLAAHPPFGEHIPCETEDGVCPPPEATPHVLIVGSGELGRSVVIHAVRQWRDRFSPGKDPTQSAFCRLRLTMIGRDVRSALEWLRLRHPHLEDWCDLHGLEMDTGSPRLHRGYSPSPDAAGVASVPPSALPAALSAYGEGLDAGDGRNMTAYVCLPDDSECLSVALSLNRQMGSEGRGAARTVACLTREAGLASLLHGWETTGGEEEPGSLTAFSLLEHTCDPELILGGTTELLARALHDHYLHQNAGGPGAAAGGSLVTWEDLSEDKKESNRRQADHIQEKLRAVHCSIVPLLDWEDRAFEFAPAEVELMARMEHDRWSEDRRRQGWTAGPRDETHKTHPLLVPWEQLTEEAREVNRSFIRLTPDLLLRAGLQVRRWGQPSATASTATETADAPTLVTLRRDSGHTR